MAQVSKIVVHVEPTAFAKWLVKHWYVGVLVAPFFGLLPNRWLAKAVVIEKHPNEECG